MDRIGILGLSLSETDLADLERVSGPVAAGGDALWLELADDLAASELVVLATCNRVEIVYARESGHQPEASDAAAVLRSLGLEPGGDPAQPSPALHFHGGRAAARHLFRVVSSLDSLVVGEAEILAQVRAAYAESERLRLAGRLLGGLFEHAFQVGKQVRTETELGHRPLSVVGVGVGALVERFSERDAGAPAPRIAVVGAGEMGTLAARTLRDAGLPASWIVNRSMERATALAAALGGRALELERFQAGRAPVDAIVAATAAPGVVLDGACLGRLHRTTPGGRPLLAIDLALPRDLEPTEGVELIDLEQLRRLARENRAQRRRAAREAETLVERKLDRLAHRFTQHRVAAAIADLRIESSAIFERELAQLFRGPLAELDEPSRRALERWARGAFGRVSHVPISAMKQLAQELAGEDEPAQAEARKRERA